MHARARTQVWELNSLQKLKTLQGHTDAVRALAVADGRLFSGSYDSTVRVWDEASMQCLEVLKGHSGPVRTPVSRRAHTPMMRSEQLPASVAKAHKHDNKNAPQRAAFAAFGSQLDADGAWLDHLTSDLFPPGTQVSHIAWPHLDDYCHWLQAGWMEPV